MRAGLAILLAVLAGGAEAQPRSLFPPDGCSPTSRFNPCLTRMLPAPVGDPTDGPLTEAMRQGPLDLPPDPLDFTIREPEKPGEPVLAPARDRLGAGGRG
jgi:hypothetical protein